MITDKTRKALQILADKPDLTATDFAARMWEDSPAWSKAYDGGHGVARGKGMWLSAGGYLSKLEKRGLVFITRTESGQITFRLSSAGRTALKDAADDRHS